MCQYVWWCRCCTEASMTSLLFWYIHCRAYLLYFTLVELFGHLHRVGLQSDVCPSPTQSNCTILYKCVMFTRRNSCAFVTHQINYTSPIHTNSCTHMVYLIWINLIQDHLFGKTRHVYSNILIEIQNQCITVGRWCSQIYNKLTLFSRAN